MTPSTLAASVTVRASGPAVSWSAVIGMIPSRLTRPTVGLMPTNRFCVPGLRIDPDVSVPIDTVTRFALTAIPGPELDPPGDKAGRPSLNGRPNPSTPGRGSGRGSNGLNP